MTQSYLIRNHRHQNSDLTVNADMGIYNPVIIASNELICCGAPTLMVNLRLRGDTLAAPNDLTELNMINWVVNISI